MSLLLDVNLLLASRWITHVDHVAVRAWLDEQAEFHTTPIVELAKKEKWGQCAKIDKKCPSRLRIPSLLEEVLQFQRQLCICFRSIKPAQLLAHIRRAAHRQFFGNPLLRNRRPFPKQLSEGQLPQIRSFQSGEILCHQSRRFQAISQPALRLFLTVRRHLRGLPIGSR